MTLTEPTKGTRGFLARLNPFRSPEPVVTPQPRCTCGRFCKHEAPDITDKLVADMTKAGLYVPARFAARRSEKGA